MSENRTAFLRTSSPEDDLHCQTFLTWLPLRLEIIKLREALKSKGYSLFIWLQCLIGNGQTGCYAAVDKLVQNLA